MPLKIFVNEKEKLCEELSLDHVMSCVQSGEYSGLCIECGTEHSDIEPDARRYKCENCGLDSVYGAEELLFISLE